MDAKSKAMLFRGGLHQLSTCSDNMNKKPTDSYEHHARQRVIQLCEEILRKKGGCMKDNVADKGFLRLEGVLKIFPVSKTVWYDGIRRGDYPKPVKLSERTSAWRVSDIKALCEKYRGGF